MSSSDRNEEIESRELEQRRTDAGLVLLDVREDTEFATGHIPGAVHIPLGQLPLRVGELSPDAETIVYCAHGARSAMAAQFLRSRGFGRVLNLTGGIETWRRLASRSGG